MLEEAATRLAGLTVLMAAVVVLVQVFQQLAQPQLAGVFRDPVIRLTTLGVVLLALGVFALKRYKIATASAVLVLGMVFEVAVAFAISIVETAVPFVPDSPVLGISSLGPWIVLVGVIIPNRPVWTLVTALVAATTWPVAFAINTARHGLAIPPWGQLLVWPTINYLMAVLAYGIGRRTYGTARQVQMAMELGSYRLESPIGHGGMGEVWKATHQMLARPAAIEAGQARHDLGSLGPPGRPLRETFPARGLRDRHAPVAAHGPSLRLRLLEGRAAVLRHGAARRGEPPAFERVDAHIGELVAAAQAAGIGERTAFVVTGDHGFHRIHSELRPNVVLRQAGLLTLGADGRVSDWKAIAHRAAIRLANPADAETAARERALFEEHAGGRYRGLLRLVERAELLAREADAEALLYLEPVEGYAVSDALAGDEFVAASTSRGSHGFLPELEAMHTGLLLAGVGVRRGLTAPLARMVDVAPTVARLLGFELPEAEGIPMVGLLEAGGH